MKNGPVTLPAYYVSLASVNANLIKNAAGGVIELVFLTFTNVGAGSAYLKIYDSNTTNGPATTETPKLKFILPSGGYNQGLVIPDGIKFTSGFAFRITGALADSDATVIGANEVVLNYGLR